MCHLDGQSRFFMCVFFSAAAKVCLYIDFVASSCKQTQRYSWMPEGKAIRGVFASHGLRHLQLRQARTTSLLEQGELLSDLNGSWDEGGKEVMKKMRQMSIGKRWDDRFLMFLISVGLSVTL